jgi:hypothetical protein
MDGHIDERRAKNRYLLLIGAGVVLVAVTFFRVPLATVFLLGLVLMCPLMMFGMHGGHGGAHGTPGDDVNTRKDDRADRRRAAS